MEVYGRWTKASDSFEDLRAERITSRRRRNLKGGEIKASMVVTNNETLNHLEDYQ